jgi:C1q domain
MYFDRTSTVDATIATVDPVTFDTVHVNQGGLYSSATGVVTIASSGYYYVHISAASTVGKVSLISIAYYSDVRNVHLTAAATD